MTADEAFKEGLRLVKEAMIQKGLPPEKAPKGGDIPVLAAYAVFCKQVKGKELDERFPKQAPIFAKYLILQAFANNGNP